VGEVFAYYFSRRIELTTMQGFAVFDIEPAEGVSLLALTATALVGTRVRKQGGSTGVSVSRSAVALSEVRGINSSWRGWIDPARLDDLKLGPGRGVTADIELRSSLGEFGNTIHLPLRTEDYRADPTAAVRRFVEVLEEQLPRSEPQ
jgi:hypothetical protein